MAGNALSSPSTRLARSRISPAAFFVKVTKRICSGKIPFLIIRTIRAIRQWVLPAPGTAMTAIGPSICSTILRCSGVNPFSKSTPSAGTGTEVSSGCFSGADAEVFC